MNADERPLDPRAEEILRAASREYDRAHDAQPRVSTAGQLTTDARDSRSDVLQGLRDLDRALSVLDDRVVVELTQQLNTVLRPPTKSEVTDAVPDRPPADETSPLADVLQDHAARVTRLIRHLDQLLDRLDV